MSLPDEYTDGAIEDIQDVDADLGSLIDRFIRPIDALRSAAAPSSLFGRAQRRIVDNNDVSIAVAQDLNETSFDPTEAKESRVHAFYRLMGFPVMGAGGFYNPGFNPNLTEKSKTAHYTIGNSVDENITSAQALRENGVRVRANIHKKMPYQSSLLASVMHIPKKFQVLDTGKKFSDKDEQRFTLPVRKLFINTFYEKSDGGDIDTNFYVSGSHMLRPFLVDPTISNSVMPANRLVCAPFLKNKSATKLDSSTYLKRPGIEFILSLRLSQSPTLESQILNDVIFTLDPGQDIEGLSKNEVKQLASALLDENKVSGSQVDVLLTTSFEIIQLNKLVKTIKALVYKLVRAIETIYEVSNNIEWTPLPGELGPEDASKLVIAGQIRTRARTSPLEIRIDELGIKSANSKRLSNLNVSPLDFAIAEYENTEKLFIDELNEAKEQRNEYIRQGAEALSTIEYITGEVSGLGLIDILAVYTALWAIDLDVLVSLLDDDSFDRLYEFNKDLRNENVETRKGGGPVFSGEDAMNKLEAQIISILAFADKELERRLANPPVADGGQPA